MICLFILLVIQCDASSTGLCSTLMQEGKPLAYASRALSTTEVGYAQIEKECLAIIFSLERFHQYTENDCQHPSQTPGDDCQNITVQSTKE